MHLITFTKELMLESKKCWAETWKYLKWWKETWKETNYNFVSQYRKFVRWITVLSYSAKNLRGELQFCRAVSKILRQNHNLVWHCWKLCEVNYNFISQCRKFCGVPPVYTQLFELRGCFSVQRNFLWIFWLVVFYFVSTNILKHQLTVLIKETFSSKRC